MTKSYKRARLVLKNIAYFQGLHEMTDTQMARILGKSKATYSARKNQRPQDMTLDELVRAAEYFKVNPEQLLVPLKGSEVEAYE